MSFCILGIIPRAFNQFRTLSVHSESVPNEENIFDPTKKGLKKLGRAIAHGLAHGLSNMTQIVIVEKAVE
jgi:hypothetical protein